MHENVYKDNMLKFYREMYYHQIEQRDKISDRISIPLTIFIALLGSTLYFITNYKDNLIYLIVLIIYIQSLIVTAINFYKAYYNYEYQYLPKLDVINTYVTELEEFYSDNYENYFKINEISQEQYINEKLYIFLRDGLVGTTSINVDSNLRKTRALRKLGFFLAINSLIFIITFFLNISL